MSITATNTAQTLPQLPNEEDLLNPETEEEPGLEDDADVAAFLASLQEEDENEQGVDVEGAPVVPKLPLIGGDEEPPSEEVMALLKKAEEEVSNLNVMRALLPPERKPNSFSFSPLLVAGRPAEARAQQVNQANRPSH